MPYFLRKIRKGRWLMPDVGFRWLEENDIPADPLADLTTKENQLSVWHVEDDRSNLDNILVGLAVPRDHLDHIDYDLIADGCIQKLGIRATKVADNTLGPEVREWHYHLQELSAGKVTLLAKEMLPSTHRERVHWKRLRDLLLRAIEEGRVQLEDLKPEVAKRLG